MDSFKLKLNDIIVLDFDGTMCRLFHNYDLKETVKTLKRAMQDFDIVFDLSKGAYDIFKEIVFQTSNDLFKRKKALEISDLILTNAELDAVKTCEPINGVAEVLPYLLTKGYSIGVSTNNSKECVHAFLEKYCNGINLPIVGRNGLKPELMKPNTWPLENIIEILEGDPLNAIFVGDTKSDFCCAKKVGCKFVGMAITKKKCEILQEILLPNQIVSNYFELSTML